MFDDKTRAASQSNLTGFGDALRRPRAGPQPRDRGARPAADQPRAGDAEPVRPADAACAPVPRARARPRATSRRSPRRRPRCSATSTRPSRALADVARPFLQDSISDGPAGARRRRSRTFPQQRPFLANSAALFRELRPGVRALRTAAPDLADALEIGTPTLQALGRRSTSSLEPAFEALERFAEDPLVTARRAATSTSTVTHPRRRRSRYLTPAQTVCNYVTLWFRNVVEPAQRGRRERHLAALHHHRHARRGPNNEGGPSSAPANGASRARRTTTCTPTRTRTPPRRASRRSARPATSPTSSARQVIGNVPGNQGTNHREDDAAALMLGRRTVRRRARAAQGPHGREPRSRSALVVLVVACIGVYFGFTKDIPFTHGFRLKAVFQSANSIRDELAGADRRRQRRQGHEDRAQARHATPPS